MKRISKIKKWISTAISRPRELVAYLKRFPEVSDGRAFALAIKRDPATPTFSEDKLNDLQKYFDSNLTGPGIWKWLHYFKIYDQHLKKFRGCQLVMVEVGIYSGGSLGMWQHYFGSENLTLHGIDIEPDCAIYKKEGVHVHIGDQEDRQFWRAFLKEVPRINVFLDDGGHTPSQQIVTFEEVFPALAPGGIYICEDIHGSNNGFHQFIAGLSGELHHSEDLGNSITGVQATVEAVHVFPYLIVVEKASNCPTNLSAERRGTEWQPFYEKR